MAGRLKSAVPVTAESLQGFKYFDSLGALLKRLHTLGTERDKASNRELFYDQYVTLLLLYYFNPTLTSLRSLQAASSFAKVRKTLGVKRTSVSAMHEASVLFDPAPLRDIIQELAAQAVQAQQKADSKRVSKTSHTLEGLKGLTAVDGTFLHALPRMFWALCGNDKPAAKMHLHFDVLTGVPSDATVTAGSGGETEQLRLSLKPGRLYVTDRGYANYHLFRHILDAGSSFVARVKSNVAFTVAKELTVTPAAREAGVTRDLVMDKLGTSHHVDAIQQPLRLVIVETTSPDGRPYTLYLVTDRLELSAEMVAQAYRYRWSIELFFRWFKCVLGCRHPLAESINGLTIQCYVGLIASLLIVVWTELRPCKRTWEMIQFYFQGWASLEELEEHLTARRAKELKQALAAAGKARS